MGAGYFNALTFPYLFIIYEVKRFSYSFTKNTVFLGFNSVLYDSREAVEAVVAVGFRPRAKTKDLLLLLYCVIFWGKMA